MRMKRVHVRPRLPGRKSIKSWHLQFECNLLQLDSMDSGGDSGLREDQPWDALTIKQHSAAMFGRQPWEDWHPDHASAIGLNAYNCRHKLYAALYWHTPQNHECHLAIDSLGGLPQTITSSVRVALDKRVMFMQEEFRGLMFLSTMVMLQKSDGEKLRSALI